MSRSDAMFSIPFMLSQILSLPQHRSSLVTLQPGMSPAICFVLTYTDASDTVGEKALKLALFGKDGLKYSVSL